MNINRVINMVVAIFMKKILNLAMNKGAELAARRSKSDVETTDADRAQAQSGRQIADRTKKIRNATRRLF